MDLMKEELSEPYPIFTYRYFLNGWPAVNIMVFDKNMNNKFIGCIIGKCERNKKGKMKGYIAMIAVEKDYRGKRIGKNIGELFISQCKNLYHADEIELETEITNVTNFHGVIRRFGINHNNFIGYRLRSFQTLGNVVSLVERNEYN